MYHWKRQVYVEEVKKKRQWHKYIVISFFWGKNDKVASKMSPKREKYYKA